MEERRSVCDLGDSFSAHEDFKLACALLEKYAQRDGQVALVKKNVGAEEQGLYIVLPEWLDVLALELKARHGTMAYPFILSQVVHRLVLIWRHEGCITALQGRTLEQIALFCYHDSIAQCWH